MFQHILYEVIIYFFILYFIYKIFFHLFLPKTRSVLQLMIESVYLLEHYFFISGHKK